MDTEKNIIVAVPNENGSYKDADGKRVNLFSFPQDRKVRTQHPVFKDSSIDELLESGEFTKLDTQQAIPKSTPFYEDLIDDSRFSTIESLLEHKDELTDINGIGPSRKEEIINHVTNSQ